MGNALGIAEIVRYAVLDALRAELKGLVFEAAKEEIRGSARAELKAAVKTAVQEAVKAAFAKPLTKEGEAGAGEDSEDAEEAGSVPAEKMETVEAEAEAEEGLTASMRTVLVASRAKAFAFCGKIKRALASSCQLNRQPPFCALGIGYTSPRYRLHFAAV